MPDTYVRIRWHITCNACDYTHIEKMDATPDVVESPPIPNRCTDCGKRFASRYNYTTDLRITGLL